MTVNAEQRRFSGDKKKNMHPTMDQFRKHLELEGRPRSAREYYKNLKQFSGWLDSKGIDPLRATTADIRAYQRWLAEVYKTKTGAPLEITTQGVRMANIKSYYRYLYQMGLVVVDAGRKIQLPPTQRKVSNKDYLTLQEATAMVQTQAKCTLRYEERSRRWAREMRSLAALCIGLATGRRRLSLMSIKVADVDFSRNEIRIEREKGKSGRVLPVAGWAMAVLKEYVEKARPVLNWHKDNPWLFVGKRAPRMGLTTFTSALLTMHLETVKENPDLEELGDKVITPHGLRVSFATLLFQGGANIRSVNELMNHSSLSTTARYTPIPLEELRRVCKLAHPRA